MRDNLDELRHIEGFPIGEDEDLHTLSDPPYYTAYPNPHIAEFIKQYGKPYDEATDDYHCEPYVSDVSEGKNDPIYNAHSYHTKVPYKAIIPFINHYTEPGDIVLDGFCGTGMTGVAAQMCGRRIVMCDLSPLATFVSFNYNKAVDASAYEHEALGLLNEVESECGWIYETQHRNGKRGKINYTVWSDVFTCPYCKGDVVFTSVALDKSDGSVKHEFRCPTCKAELTKNGLPRAIEHVYDSSLGREVAHVKQVPVLIDYNVGRDRYTKSPDNSDWERMKRIEDTKLPYWYPSNPMMEIGSEWGDTWRAGVHFGVTHVHHFYTRGALWTLGATFDRLRRIRTNLYYPLVFTFEQAILGMSKLARYVPTHYSQVNQYLSGTLYIGSQVVDPSLPYVISGKIGRLTHVFDITSSFAPYQSAITT